MNDIIITLYVLTASILMFQLAFVLRQAINDNYLRQNDSPGVILARKASFATGFFFVPLTVILKDYWLVPALNVNIVVSIGIGTVLTALNVIAIGILSVSMVSMRQRAPPAAEHGFPGHAPHVHVASRLRANRIKRWEP